MAEREYTTIAFHRKWLCEGRAVALARKRTNNPRYSLSMLLQRGLELAVMEARCHENGGRPYAPLDRMPMRDD